MVRSVARRVHQGDLEPAILLAEQARVEKPLCDRADLGALQIQQMGEGGTRVDEAGSGTHGECQLPKCIDLISPVAQQQAQQVTGAREIGLGSSTAPSGT